MRKQDLTGEARVRQQHRGPLAASSTLNRLELSTRATAASDRYKKIAADPQALEGLLVDLFVESYKQPPREIWLDLDATDDPLHGHQEGRFFRGYYRCYYNLPLHIFCGEHLLCARLQSSNQDAAAGSVEELQRIVSQNRARWPKTRRPARSGFRSRWRIASRNSSSDSLPIGTSAATMRATSCACTSPRLTTCSCTPYGRLGLAGTARAKVQSTTIRMKLLKIGARIRITVRKVWLSFSEACPYAVDIAQILANLQRHPLWTPPG